MRKKIGMFENPFGGEDMNNKTRNGESVARAAMQNSTAVYIVNRYMNGLLNPKSHVYVPANWGVTA